MLFTASFAGLVPNRGLGPYCVAKYGVVALAEVLWRELREHQIGVSVLCPIRVGTNIGHSERNRTDEYGGPSERALVADQDESNEELAGRVLEVERRRRAHGRRHPGQPAVRAAPRGEPRGRSAAASTASTPRSTSRPRPARDGSAGDGDGGDGRRRRRHGVAGLVRLLGPLEEVEQRPG